ncbi:MAG: TonB family protein [bacterium]
MKYFGLFLCLISLLGCYSIPQMSEPSVPRLLVQYPLPEVPESLRRPFQRIDILLFITEEGAVEKVRLLSSSGSLLWDSLAANIIRKWQFVPAHIQEKPAAIWLRLQASLKYESPSFMAIAEILCRTRDSIDSAYSELKQGKDFGAAASRYSIGSSRENMGALGMVNINCYASDIRRIIAKLRIDEFSEPLKYGEQYVIFKRLKE